MVTVITKTIGSGKDYASFTLAEADVENIGTSANLVANDEAIVFEADAGTYAGGTFIQSTLVTDPTRNVTYTVAAGSEHGGDPASGVIIETSGGSGTAGFWVYDSHTIFDGLNLKTTVGDDSKGWRFQDVASTSTVIRNCIFVGSSSAAVASDAIYALYHGYSAVPTVVENCRLSGQCFFRTTTTDGNWRFINNTLLADPAQPTVEFRGIAASAATATTITVDVTNNWGNCTRSYYSSGPGTTNLTGSNNYAEGTGVYDFSAAIRGTPYPITATTLLDPGPGDWAIYDAATGALIDDPDNDVLAGGVGPDANPDVPTTDILGNPRTGLTTEPGAFVLVVTPPVVEDTWTPVMVRRNDPVDVYGVLTFGDAYINAVEDTLTATGPGQTDTTPAIPVGTRALWIQLVSQSGAAAGETADVRIEVSASQYVTLATLNGAGTAVGNVPGLMQFPVDCLDQDDPDSPTYPRIKLATGATVSPSDVVTLRVVAICGQQTNTTWT